MDENVHDPIIAAEYYLQHAFEQYDAGRFEVALRSCDKALHHYPSLPDLYNLRGALLEKLNRPHEAVDAFWRALELAPDLNEARKKLRDLAVEWARRPSADTPTPEGGAGEPPARGLFRRDPEAEIAALHLEHAFKAYDDGRYEAALTSSILTLALDPDSAEAHNLRGLALEELDRPDAAVEAYRQAFRLDDSFEEARENRLELQAVLAERRGPVTVAAFLHPLDAHIARGILEGAGIPSFLADEEIAALNYFWANGFHGIKLQVTRENADEAREVLRGEPVGDERELGEKDGQRQCERCGSYHTRYETYNLKLAYLATLLAFFPLLDVKALFVLLLPIFLFLIPRRAWVCRSCGHIWKV